MEPKGILERLAKFDTASPGCVAFALTEEPPPKRLLPNSLFISYTRILPG